VAREQKGVAHPLSKAFATPGADPIKLFFPSFPDLR